MEIADSHHDSEDETPSVAVASNGQDREPPESSNDDDSGAVGDKSSRDALAKGISSLLSSVIKDFDSRAQDTLRSQDQLNSSIDRLTQRNNLLTPWSSNSSLVIFGFFFSNDQFRVDFLHVSHGLNSFLAKLTWDLTNFVAELDQLLEDAPSPFIMQHAARISNVRKKVSSLNAVLRSIQRRTDNIDRMLFIGLSQGTCRLKYRNDKFVIRGVF